MNAVDSVIPTKNLDLYCDEIEARMKENRLKLPVLPKAVQKILSMSNNPEFDVGELSDLIHKDPTLAGHVLRVSNSSIYGGAYKINSLNQAVARLGSQAIVKIAVSITMRGEVFRVAGFKEEVTHIWRHALASGVYAQELSDVCKITYPEMYMCGLLHQVGKPVLMQTMVDISKAHKLPLSPPRTRTSSICSIGIIPKSGINWPPPGKCRIV